MPNAAREVVLRLRLGLGIDRRFGINRGLGINRRPGCGLGLRLGLGHSVHRAIDGDGVVERAGRVHREAILGGGLYAVFDKDHFALGVHHGKGVVFTRLEMDIFDQYHRFGAHHGHRDGTVIHVFGRGIE